MDSKMLSTIRPVEFPLGPGWTLSNCSLTSIHPQDADSFINDLSGGSVWHSFFSEDLLWAENYMLGTILSVGWYPECDPDGEYVLRHKEVVSDEPNQPDWYRMLRLVRTRSTTDLFQTIESILRN